MTRPRAVLFGLGGTLVAAPDDPGPALAAALGLDADAAERLGALVLGTTFDAPAALATRLRSELGLAEDPAVAVDAVWRAQSAEPGVFDRAAACVGAVHAAGARVAVVAAASTPFADAARTACVPFATAIDHWFVSSELAITEPSGLLAHALAALAVAPADALVIGSNLVREIRPALALGAGAVWLRHEAGVSGAIAIDPHAAPPTDVLVPESAVVACSLGEARGMALTRLWGARGARLDLTGPLPA